MEIRASGAVFSNPTIFAAALASIKCETGMDKGVRATYALLSHFGPGMIGSPPYLGTVNAWAFHNRYPIDFVDTNNLSLAVFVQYADVTVLFAGDLEGPGWRALLRWQEFRSALAMVKIIIAAHHRRLSGLCEEAFSLCRPEVVVISDDSKQYNSQETNAWFRQRTIGIPDYRYPMNGLTGFPKRHVLTTRSDGMIAINVLPSGRYVVTPEHGPPALPPPPHLFRHLMTPSGFNRLLS